MAQNGTIIIKIVQDQSDGETPQVDTSGVKATQKSQQSDLKTAAITTVIQRAASSLKEMGVSQVRFQINRYFDMTDNYLGQQSMNIALSSANRLYNAGASVVGGFMVAGPAGAVIMGLVEVAKVGLDIYHNYSEQDLKLRKMNAELQFNRQRAGYSLTVGSQGENR